MPRPDSLHHTTHYRRPDDVAGARMSDYFALQTWADCWDDSTTPRTENPARFRPRIVEPFGLCWGLQGRYALVAPSAIVQGFPD